MTLAQTQLQIPPEDLLNEGGSLQHQQDRSSPMTPAMKATIKRARLRLQERRWKKLRKRLEEEQLVHGEGEENLSAKGIRIMKMLEKRQRKIQEQKRKFYKRLLLRPWEVLREHCLVPLQNKFNWSTSLLHWRPSRIISKLEQPLGLLSRGCTYATVAFLSTQLILSLLTWRH